MDRRARRTRHQRHWLQQMVQTEAHAGIRKRRGRRDEFEPPRLGEAKAVDRAAAMQDHFQRQFLRLMKCYRDGRRLIASMTMLGGQVNVAEQQVVIADKDTSELA